MKVNQYILFKDSGAFHCMEVYTDNDSTGYVLDRAFIYVEYDRQKGYWTETSRVEREID